MSRRWWGSRYVFIEESFSHRRWRVLFKRKIFRCQLPQHKKKETNTEQCRQQSSLVVEHGRNSLKKCYPPPSFAGGLHQRFAFSSTVLILLSITAFLRNSLILVALPKEYSLHPPFSDNNWPAAWSCCPASLCNLLDVFGFSKIVTLKRTYIIVTTFWVFNLVASLCGFFWSPYNRFVQQPSYISLPGNITRIVHKDFSHSQISPSTSTRSTTAEPNKCTEHGTIPKGSVQCTVGAVSISCLLCTNMDSGYCDRSY